jgi:hypothetical protein
MKLFAAALLLLAGCAESQPSQRSSAPVTEDLPPEEERREGAITPEEYQAVDDYMHRKMEVLHHCYEEELSRRMDRSFQGLVTIEMKIARDGHVTAMKILEDTLKSPVVNACLSDTIKKFEFGSLTGEASFVYPIQFAPQY